jgi:hypothetical protein
MYFTVIYCTMSFSVLLVSMAGNNGGSWHLGSQKIFRLGLADRNFRALHNANRDSK